MKKLIAVLLTVLIIAAVSAGSFVFFAQGTAGTAGDADLDGYVTAQDAMLVGDANAFPKDFFRGITKGKKMAGNDECDEPTKEVYNIITKNADVIKGVFAAHNHSDMHVDIMSQNPDGTKADMFEIMKHTAGNYGIDDYNATLKLK